MNDLCDLPILGLGGTSPLVPLPWLRHCLPVFVFLVHQYNYVVISYTKNRIVDLYKKNKKIKSKIPSMTGEQKRRWLK